MKHKLMAIAPYQWRLLGLRLGLALAASCAAALALSGSFVGPALGKVLANVSSALGWIPGLGTLSLLPSTQAAFFYTFIALIALTTLFSSPRSRSPEESKNGLTRIKALVFIYLAVLAPVLLSHSSVDWLRFALHRPLDYSTPPLVETLALVVSTSFCLFSIYLVTRYQESYSTLITQEVEAIDRETYLRGSLQVGLAIAGGAFALTVAGLLLAFGLSRGLEQLLEYIPWPVVVLGLVGISIMAIVVFQSMFQKPPTREENA